MPQYDIFITYARSDNKGGRISQFVKDLRLAYERTTGKSLQIFFDESSIEVADIWETRIIGALESSWLLVPILSREFFRSAWCAQEFLSFEHFIKEKNDLQEDLGLVVPVRYQKFEEGDQYARVDAPLRGVLNRQWVDFASLKRGSEAYADTLESFARHLRKMLEPSVGDSSLERLPVAKNINIEQIEYGEGSRVDLVTKERLVYVDIYNALEKEYVNFDGTFQYLPRRIVDNGTLGASQLTKVPHRIIVRGKKSSQRAVVGVYVCVGIHYFQAFDRRRNVDEYEVECLIGRGGIADFVDSKGRFQNDNPLIFGDGLGAVCGIVVIEFEGRSPARRSEHALVIRAGIRYPDDIWISRNTGMPITSRGDSIAAARFIFQSRQPNGQSCDIFAADFNGSNMVNLTQKQEDSYDGLFDDSGAEIGRWVDHNIVEYCSMSGGRRVIKRVRDQHREIV